MRRAVALISVLVVLVLAGVTPLRADSPEAAVGLFPTIHAAAAPHERVQAELRTMRASQGAGRWDWLRSLVFPPSPPPDNAAAAFRQQGGMRIVLKIDSEAVGAPILLELQGEVRRVLRERRIALTNPPVVRDRSIEVRIRDGEDPQRLLEGLAPFMMWSGSPPVRAVDAEIAGELIRFTPTAAAVQERLAQSRRQSIAIIKRRLAQLGIDTSVRPDGPERIVVLLPGRKSLEGLMQLIPKSAQLSFRFVDTSTSMDDAFGGRAPVDTELLYNHASKAPILVKRQVAAFGQDIVEAAAAFDRHTREPVVTFRLGVRGVGMFARMTNDNVGRAVAVVLDDEVIASAIIREPIVSGAGQISGGYSVEEARGLSVLLTAGVLPAPLIVVDQQVVEPE